MLNPFEKKPFGFSLTTPLHGTSIPRCTWDDTFFIKMMCNHKVLGIGAVLGQNPGKTLLFSKQNRWQMDVPPETYETYEQRINAWLFFVNDQGIMVTMNDQISMVSQPQLPTSANHPVLFMCFSMVF
jgi:hypothetical protein